MKGRVIVLGQIDGIEAAALMVDGRLEDLALDHSHVMEFSPGAILRGRVERLMKGQGGAFLRLPDGATGFLRAKSGLREGQTVLVQVSGAAEKGKALPLTSRLLLRGALVIATPGAPGVNVSRSIRAPALRDELQQAAEDALSALALGDSAPGIIIRSAASDADIAEIEAELTQLASLAAAIARDEDTAPALLVDAPRPDEIAFADWITPPPGAVMREPGAFEQSGAEDALRALRSPRIALPGGASAMIEPTSALVAIDVNTGPDTSPAASLKANIALIRDLPRQLRLRGLGGQVVIDFAPVSKRDRGTLEQEITKAFRRESAETALPGWTRLGLFELTRKRDRAPLTAFLGEG
ncbi:MAG: ribonuclease E/G [Paracoccus sp. (in: a-proteobacteria)]|nr:ribonuclease E/G [Paracoccus sp. (in: a-proteobacteria)]